MGSRAVGIRYEFSDAGAVLMQQCAETVSALLWADYNHMMC